MNKSLDKFDADALCYLACVMYTMIGTMVGILVGMFLWA